MDYVKKVEHGKDSGARGLGLAGTLTGGAALLGNLASGGGILPGLFGGAPRAAYGGYGPVGCGCEQVVFQGGYVTEKELGLTREIGGKDAEIARLQAEKYTDQVVAAATIPLANRICELEKFEAVNAARDQDFRRYVNAEFVHQPKARMNQQIVTCRQCGCDCRCDDWDGFGDRHCC